MIITETQLLKVIPKSASKVKIYVPVINKYADTFGIDTPLRLSHFIAQCLHETSEFVHVRELGNEAYCRKYEVGKLAKMLGNTQKGDGYKYKGRGLLQLTGRANYQAYQDSKYCNGDIIANPNLLEQPIGAVKSAMWYWMKRGLNRLADKDDFLGVTKAINGGTNGLESRRRYLTKCKAAFGV